MVATKSTLLLLSTSLLTLASPANVPKLDINGEPMGKLANRGRFKPPHCVLDDVLLALQDRHNKQQASSYCSTYLRTTITRTATAADTVYQTITAVSTSIETDAITETETAPAPINTVTIPGGECHINGFGSATYNVGSGSSSVANFDGCKGFCQNIAGAVSFGFGGGQCACYRANVQTIVRPASSSYYFYDLSCPSQAAPPAKRNGHPHSPPPPPPPPKFPFYLREPCEDRNRISSACSCLITRPSCPTVKTVTATQANTLTTTVNIVTAITTTNTILVTVTPSPVTQTVTGSLTYGP